MFLANFPTLKSLNSFLWGVMIHVEVYIYKTIYIIYSYTCILSQSVSDMNLDCMDMLVGCDVLMGGVDM